MKKNIKEISDRNERIVFIAVLSFLILGASFMYWGYKTVAHPTELPTCKEAFGFNSVAIQVTTQETFFHRFYNIEPYRGPFCINEND